MHTKKDIRNSKIKTTTKKAADREEMQAMLSIDLRCEISDVNPRATQTPTAPTYDYREGIVNVQPPREHYLADPLAVEPAEGSLCLDNERRLVISTQFR